MSLKDRFSLQISTSGPPPEGKKHSLSVFGNEYTEGECIFFFLKKNSDFRVVKNGDTLIDFQIVTFFESEFDLLEESYKLSEQDDPHNIIPTLEPKI